MAPRSQGRGAAEFFERHLVFEIAFSTRISSTALLLFGRRTTVPRTCHVCWTEVTLQAPHTFDHFGTESSYPVLQLTTGQLNKSRTEPSVRTPDYKL